MTDYNNNDADRARPYREQLEVAFHELEDVLDEANVNRVQSGGIGESTRKKLEARVLIFRQRLLPFARKDGAVARIWDEYNINAIPNETARVVGVTEAKDTVYGIKSGGGEPIIQRADPAKLMMWGNALIQAYSELGFGPEMDEKDLDAGKEESL